MEKVAFTQMHFILQKPHALLHITLKLCKPIFIDKAKLELQRVKLGT
jgi:hypothetical protein